MTDASINSRKALILEETLSQHFAVLKVYLGPYLRDEKGNLRPSRAKDKLTRLSQVQFQELSTDVYDESLRREQERKKGGPNAPGNDTPKFLLPKNNFHPKRNQARQKLSTLPLERFRQLATDVYYELDRRFPRFSGGDIERIGSPAGSVASRGSGRGPPSRGGTPNSMNGAPPPGFRRPPPPQGGMPYRNGPPGPPPPGGLRPGSQASQGGDFGRPLPKTFQSNTIVPNKSTMVEDDDDGSGMDDDDDDQEDAFNLEGATTRQSRRQTNKSLKSVKSMIGPGQEKLLTDLQSQVSQLQGKVDTLEGDLKTKEEEVEKLTSSVRDRENASSSQQAEWDELRSSLESKVNDAENLNSSLRSEIDKLRNDNSSKEREFDAHINELQMEVHNLEDQLQNQSSNGQGEEWRHRYEDLERELTSQQQVTEEVRQQASQFLQEMKELSRRNDQTLEKEERLQGQVSSLESELRDWKSRYAVAKTKLRTLRASSVGLGMAMHSPELNGFLKDRSFASPDGLVKDIHVTKFQLSIDEYLQVARREHPQALLDSMKNVFVCVKNITSDIGASSPASSPASRNGSVYTDSGSASPDKQQSKLKAQVSATTNNLITASKNHASSAGMSPISVVDAAASHLSTAVVELVKFVKIRPTPPEELQEEEEADRPMPLNSHGAGGSPYGLGVSGLGSGHMRHRSRGGSTDSASYRTSLNSPRHPHSSWASRKSLSGIIPEVDSGMSDLRTYLDDQTALLVQSIQPLVHAIRSLPPSAVIPEQDSLQLSNYISDIGQAVQDTALKVQESVAALKDPALKKHALPVVETLQDCRTGIMNVDVRTEGRKEVPPLAFRTAKAMKELMLRVERIENGDLKVEMPVVTDY
ncbi:uncharacterized protein BDZ99DRAFT_469433 [Mytilinidion resinicola]|uniref:GIT Spa2 homology (SHD) domain-containing protein n=1 Tax=Mytilinidion resinicola TaxID=574789 RepID=A0A6A6XYQ8_9PEZI|nr:uncharacterized protein BDZ99DRAFT_469433 [Mytilinidion resinicola]KAF2801696.1 hypothetical protein BDZ99DRAFT_469433 [Mytilinidion resinicola]